MRPQLQRLRESLSAPIRALVRPPMSPGLVVVRHPHRDSGVSLRKRGSGEEHQEPEDDRCAPRDPREDVFVMSIRSVTPVQFLVARLRQTGVSEVPASMDKGFFSRAMLLRCSRWRSVHTGPPWIGGAKPLSLVTLKPPAKTSINVWHKRSSWFSPDCRCSGILGQGSSDRSIRSAVAPGGLSSSGCGSGRGGGL
jgi:hypothetical protein